MSKGYKGGDFEREVCKLLSKWWTEGKRDDIFWRSSQSGGRATQRAKKGVKTFGSYGDIAALDPVGEPLLKLFTIELKRGSSHSCPGDLLDFKADNRRHPWMKCLFQTVKCQLFAGSFGWMMICRRDHRRAMVYIDRDSALLLHKQDSFLDHPGITRFDLVGPAQSGTGTVRFRFAGLTLDSFFARISPTQIIQCTSHLK